ncbi:unnamed protein product [Toxocara canis]|uniref:Uncharacterized protein n=1 Tax=Toxocara canis TaxID=6265 RepID=A0A183V4H3_TOXCA|nr:unnamed protein product [Toxocara canis]
MWLGKQPIGCPEQRVVCRVLRGRRRCCDGGGGGVRGGGGGDSGGGGGGRDGGGRDGGGDDVHGCNVLRPNHKIDSVCRSS